MDIDKNKLYRYYTPLSGLCCQNPAQQFHCEDEDSILHPLPGSKNDKHGYIKAYYGSELAVIQKNLEAIQTELASIQKDVTALKIFVNLVDDKKFEAFPISSVTVVDLIKYGIYDRRIVTALLHLEKTNVLFVRDLKTLGITFDYNNQYIRFLKKISKVSGNPVKKTDSGLWYVEKKRKKEK